MLDLLKHGEEILSRALARGGELGEIFVEETTAASIRFEDGKVERVVTGTDVGAAIRVLSGERTLLVHTNDVSRKGLVGLSTTVAGGADGERVPHCFEFRPERFEAGVKVSPKDVATVRKLKMIVEADRAARTHDRRVVQVRVMYADSLRRITIVNSDGRFVEETRPQVLFSVHVVASDGGVIQTGYRPLGGTLGYELFDAEDPVEAALEAARQACLMLDAKPAPTGRMPVVLSSEAGGTMIHEAVGHGLEADIIDKGMSKYCGRLNEMVAAPIVTVVDDGTLPQRRGSARVDDEGTPTQRTVLVEEGRLLRFLNDLRTARKMKHAPTGNGRRASFENKPIPRMTNTLIAPGKDDPAEILASTPKGLYVRKMGGGQVNTLNGDFVFDVSEGYLIENGRLGAPVRGATLIGNGPEVLQTIEMLGTDLGFAIGTCGKDGQGAPVSDAQPTLRIRELTIGGTAA